MFDIGSSELLLIIIVAVVVIGPKDLPRVLYKVGQYVGKAKAMSRHLRSGIDEMVRQAEMEELEKKWAADNKRIMAETGVSESATGEIAALPAPESGEAGPVEMHPLGGPPEFSPSKPAAPDESAQDRPA